MTKLEAVIEKLRALPAERQDAIAVEIEFLLSQRPLAVSANTPRFLTSDEFLRSFREALRRKAES